jgi:hypothetical protein
MAELLEGKKFIWLIGVICLLAFIQIAEIGMEQGYTTPVKETGIAKTEVSVGSVKHESVMTNIESIPVLGFFFDFFTVNIPDAPLVILLLVNLINLGLLAFVIFIIMCIWYDMADMIPFVG